MYIKLLSHATSPVSVGDAYYNYDTLTMDNKAEIIQNYGIIVMEILQKRPRKKV